MVVAGRWLQLASVLPTCKLFAATLEDFDHKAPPGLEEAHEEMANNFDTEELTDDEDEGATTTIQQDSYSPEPFRKLLLVDPKIEQINAVLNCLREAADKYGAGTSSATETTAGLKVTFSFTGHGCEYNGGLQCYSLANGEYVGLSEDLKLLAQGKLCKLLLVTDSCRNWLPGAREEELSLYEAFQLKLEMGWWHHASSSSCGTGALGQTTEGSMSTWAYLLYKVCFVQ
jgi:hypothetical protein